MQENLSKKEKREIAKEQKRQLVEKNNRLAQLKKWVGVFVVVGALVFAGFRFFKWLNTPTGVQDAKNLQITSSDRVLGPENASVTIVDYSDFQCPACAYYATFVSMIVKDYPEEVKIVFRHFPLTSIHPNALSASYAAEAAGIQGKFWEMHDLLYQKQKEWSDEGDPQGKFESYASDLGLELERFKSDMQSDLVEEKISADLLSASQLRLNSTPTLFLNGKQLSLPRDYESFKELIKEELN